MGTVHVSPPNTYACTAKRDHDFQMDYSISYTQQFQKSVAKVFN